MEVTEVRIQLKEDGRLRAFASVVFSDTFVVRGLKVIQDDDDPPFVSMPMRKNRSGDWKEIARPTNRDGRDYLESVVLAAYRAAGDGGAGVSARVLPRPPSLDGGSVRVVAVDSEAELLAADGNPPSTGA